MPQDTAQLAAAREAALRALVRDRWQVERAEALALPTGPALRAADGRAWALLTGDPAGALGAVLSWALRHRPGELHLLAPEGAGALARRAAAFALPVTVWQVDGRRLRPATAEPVPPEQPVPAAAAAFEPILRAAGAEPVAEHGMLLGEVLGLEVARVTVDGGRARLAVGVGRYERELHDLRHAGEPPPAALERAVADVRRLRRPAGPRHPANQLAPERWLRAVLCARPQLAGAARLEPVAPPAPRAGLRERAVAPALGTGPDGRPLLVVCGARIDLRLVPEAVDARAAAATRLGLQDPQDVGLTLALADGGDHPVVRALAGALRAPAAVLVPPPGWRALPA